MNVTRLLEILDETSMLFRKGDEVVEKTFGDVKVLEINNMPHESEISDMIKVDCHFVTVGVAKEVANDKRKFEFLDIIRQWPIEQCASLQEGPSYISVGGVLGDQARALQFFGVGEAFGIWNVITPETMGIKGDEADELAGSGFVMITGFKG